MSNLGGDIIFLDSSEDTPPQESQLMIGQVKTQDLIFGRVFDFYNGEIIRLAAYDAIIIEMTETYLTRNLVAKIRRHLDQLVFLKPIFILVTGAVQDELLSSMADGFVKDEQEVGQLSGKVNLVLHHLASFDLGKTLPYEELRMLGFLAYIASRDLKEVTPFIDRQGIYYPILSDTAQNHFEKKHFLHALDQMEKENYLHGSFYQTTYLCSDCLGDHLLYREVCPSCKSSHLLSEEIIHHFRCAHVAPMSKFRSGNQAVSALECPKCQYELKHIGVDYDKPATMHYCQNCQSEFQQYAMMAKCTG